MNYYEFARRGLPEGEAQSAGQQMIRGTNRPLSYSNGGLTDLDNRNSTFFIATNLHAGGCQRARRNRRGSKCSGAPIAFLLSQAAD